MVFSRVSTSVMAAVVVICIGTISLVEGQSGIPSCASKLSECAEYINSTTTPPSTCCNPLREAIEKEATCLCNLFNNPSLLKAFSIDVNQALRLPQRCSISGGDNICRASAPGSSVNPPPPPATPGNGVGRIASSGLLSMVLLCASVISLF